MPPPGPSESSDKWRSANTIQARSAQPKGKPGRLKPDDKQRYIEESELSPGSRPVNRDPTNDDSTRSAIAPWEDAGPNPSHNRRANSIGVRSVEAFPYPSWESMSISTGPFSGSPRSARPMDSSGNMQSAGDNTPPTPTFPPVMGRTETLDTGFSSDDRRPSVASATTVSSNASSQVRPMNQKLQDFFGEDISESQQGSQISLPQPGGSPAGKDESSGPTNSPQAPFNSNNNNNNNNYAGRQTSQDIARPRTPQLSSAVTPWVFQDHQDINNFGDAPVRPDPTGVDKARYSDRRQSSFPLKSHAHTHSHKLSLHRHRHQKSAEEPSQESEPAQSSTTRHNSLFRRDTQPASGDMQRRTKSQWQSTSPSSVQGSPVDGDAEAAKSTGDTGGGKRSLLHRIRNRRKDEKSTPEVLSRTPSVSSLQHITKTSTRDSQAKPSSRGKGPAENGTVAKDDRSFQTSAPRPSVSQTTPKKDHHSRMPFKSKRGFSTEGPSAKDSNATKADAVKNESLWDLDTDLSHMEGIVSNQLPDTTPTAASANPLGPTEDALKDPQDLSVTPGLWDAPDSWAVKKSADENMGTFQDVDENGVPAQDEDPGIPFYIRIFRPDSTFAVLSLALNSTVADIVKALGKKSALRAELDNYHIIMRKHDSSRQLEPGERPVAIQKKLLEQVGYNDSDHIEELGREDHSYLCRFNFQHARMSGYSSLDKDPGFSMNQKMHNVDLTGCNLITIPIALYKKCNEILSINLSRNISVNVPEDFIQRCTSLREIKYTGNEASRLPGSFCVANKLTILDISNNRFEQLDHAALDKLENLASFKLANNKLTSLPKYFTQFKGLRSLNISSNSLQDLPSCICEIASLVDLDVSFNMISSLPNIGQLVSLERLWATNNRLSGRLEESMSSLRSLREIDIRFNAIDNIDVCSELPQLEYLMAGHNSISSFEGSFPKVRSLYLDHNPVTRFGLESPTPSLSALSLASAKLAHLPDELFQNLSGVTKLILDKNHFVSISAQIGRLQKLESLSIARNSLSTLPAEMGRLAELRFLDVRENNINQLPSEIWFCRKLETLNLSSNVLDSFPKPPTSIPTPADQTGANVSAPSTPGVPLSEGEAEELDKLGDFGPRRTSQVSGYMSPSISPASSYRKGSVASVHGSTSTKPSLLSRTPTGGEVSPMARKDSMLLNRVTSLFAGSLRHLFLADNRLSDDVFDQLSILQELRTLNLSYNELYDIPPRTIRRWQYLSELYLSGNDLTSLPAEDLEEIPALKVLHINNNKFQVLPAELGKVSKLAVLDASSNSLKYNVSNWPYDWNWNWNPNLKYLNLSGNKRLEIKPASNYSSGRDNPNWTDFSSLSKLRVLGLMDVTLMIPSVPDTTDDRRVRTSGSTIGTMAYGVADCLGRSDHLSTLDLVVPRLEGHDDETLFGLFDGVSQPHTGSKIVKFLQENFEMQFKLELKRKQAHETAAEALRRTYLALNKDLATLASQPLEAKERRVGPRASAVAQTLTTDDLNYGCVATMMYLHGMDLFVSNVGNAQAVLIQSEGGHRFITEMHDPASPKERERIRQAGGYVSRQGKLGDVLDVSRAFGFTQLMPAIVAAPYISQIEIVESDEIILLASRELWDFLTPDFVVDLARSERGDLMRAAQKLRDLAIAFGASGKMTVMMVGVSDLRRKERARYRTHSMSMGPSGLPDEYMVTRRGKRGRDATLDSKLARLDQEVDAPIGEISLVFTDIKNSTLLWETYPIPMRSAIKMHNEVMRRHLRLIGGYEVKTEGDAFMVAFPTVTSALLWCFTIQSQLLEVQWPQEILSSVNGQEVADADGNVLFRGLSVRMGIHWGSPVCETDPVTRRMDYFGPMVNRAARISAVADGGQITVSSDFIAEVQRLLETHIETDRSNSTGSEELVNDDALNAAIRRELRSLSSHGFEVQDLGERRLKGLENPEYIYLMYPHSLSGRLLIQQQRAEAEKASSEQAGTKSRDSQLTIELDNVWDLWAVSLRLEMLCSSLECGAGCATELKPPETALLERTRERGGEVTDIFLVNFVEHQVSRIETCITSLALRNLMRPFSGGMLEQACPMADIFNELSAKLAELRGYKEQDEIEMAPA